MVVKASYNLFAFRVCIEEIRRKAIVIVIANVVIFFRRR